jgi:hypothetical protein
LPNSENVDEKSKTNRKICEQRRYDQYSTELRRWRSCFESHCNFIDENRIKQLMTCKWYESKKEKELMPASQLPQSKRSNKRSKETELIAKRQTKGTYGRGPMSPIKKIHEVN